jgi:transcriptional regulator with XRE-family HTH domain
MKTGCIYQGTSTPQDERPRHVTGQYLAKNRLSARDRARLAAGVIDGRITVGSLTARQTARLCRVSVSRLKSVQPRKKPQRLWCSRLYIRELRESGGVKLTELAQAIGKTKGLISQIENGRCAGSVQTLEGIAKFFGLAHVGQLFEPPASRDYWCDLLVQDWNAANDAERVEFARRVGVDRIFDAAIAPVIS